jgi:hypothetical protein
LKKLLQDQPGCKDRFASFDDSNERAHFHRGRGRIASECERPDAGIDENAQSRARSFL